jgi:hypothetical protein
MRMNHWLSGMIQVLIITDFEICWVQGSPQRTNYSQTIQQLKVDFSGFNEQRPAKYAWNATEILRDLHGG